MLRKKPGRRAEKARRLLGLIGNRIEETEIFTARYRLGTLARFETWGGHARKARTPAPGLIPRMGSNAPSARAESKGNSTMPTIGLRIDRVHAHRGNDRKPSTTTRTAIRASGKSTEELTAKVNAFIARIKKGK